MSHWQRFLIIDVKCGTRDMPVAQAARRWSSGFTIILPNGPGRLYPAALALMGLAGPGWYRLVP
jgi:hypothetical protein